jgi:DNA polymerase I-like protein with 3'-5' exonuclease and polymerase domains
VTRKHAPEQFPDLRGQGMIAIDCETCDPDLLTRGSGAWRDGFIAGVAIGTEAGFRGYFPIAHEAGANLPREKVLAWLSGQLRGDVPKVGAHLAYDLGFLQAAGVEVNGLLYDVQNAEPLLDDNRPSYKLEALAQAYLEEGKKEEQLVEFLNSHFGKKDAKSLIWRAPGDVVAPYAIGDVDLPLRIFALQKPKLEKQGLWDLFILESKLIPMLVAMHRRGVRVDLDKAERLRTQMRKEKASVLGKIRDMTGLDVRPSAANDIAKVFDKLGLEYPRTTKTSMPSFRREFLEHHDHPVAGLLRRARWLEKMDSTFLSGCIIDGAVNGRVHTQFNQQKSDEGGAISGRFSSSRPNLQFIPIRSEEGKVLRTMFLPDEGQDWFRFDYSQIEYRLIAHDAAKLNLPGAQQVIDAYRSDPDTDFHRVVAGMVWGEAQADKMRDRAKTINFGLAYGEGPKKLSRDLGLPLEEGKDLIAKYHCGAPFMRPLAKGLTNMAAARGVIETILGRKRRFVWWVIPDWENRDNDKYFRWRVAGSQRAFTHKALNSRAQGSAADILKTAMVEVWESGVCDVLGPPQLSVHDELDGSAPKRSKVAREALAEIKRIMERAADILPGLRADGGVGLNWGSL